MIRHPPPTNCVADWVCPGGTGAGYPEYSYTEGPEIGYKNLSVFYSGGEQYFLILLHEIGHFTINVTPPEEYISVRKKLRKMHPKDLQMQSLAAEKYFKRKKNEREKDYLGRLEGFRTWLICGDYIIGHIVVEEWAVREFKKQRKRIKEILKHD